MICGYIMSSTRADLKPSMKMLVVSYLAWIVAIFMMYNSYSNNRAFGLFGKNANAYAALSRSIWSLSICGIVFGCHQLGTGELIRWFLHLNIWQPLSKLTLAVYLVHSIYLIKTDIYTRQSPKNGMWFMFMLHVGDILVSFVLGAAVYLCIEAPAERMLAMKWSRKNEPSRNTSSNDTYEYTKLKVLA
jgi:hypothetical protein